MRLSRLTPLALASTALAAPDLPKASDWANTGTDCKLYAAGDFDSDGFADLLTINGGRDLCITRSIHGWKSSPWSVLAGDADPDALGLAIGEADSTQPGPEVALFLADKATVFSKREGDRLTARTDIPLPAPGATLLPTTQGADIRARSPDGTLWRLHDGAFEKIPSPSTQSATTPPATPSAGAGQPPPTSPLTPPDSTPDPRWAPAYEPTAPLLTRLAADFNADGLPDTALIYTLSRPHPHRLTRIVLSPNPASSDQDSDALPDAEEAALGTDPLDRDSDSDGLLDGWEVHGLPRSISLGDLITLYNSQAADAAKDTQLNPLRQDVIVNVSYFEGVDPKQFRNEMPKVQRLYRNLASAKNPDSSTGIWIHFRELPGFVHKADQSMPWWDVGNKYFPAPERGMMHWLQVTPWGGGQSSETGDMGGCGNNAAVFAHEFGHQLSLSHTGDSEPGWCPLYPSLMNYAFSYSYDGDANAIRFSDGRFRGLELDEHHLTERLPFPYADVKYLANWPCRFPLKDNGDGTTLIDWNQNGTFDTTEVEADVNYGGSTYCGTRREHEAVGSAPSLAYVGNTCFLVAADQTKDHLWIKTYLGDEKWSDKRDLPNSGTEKDPILVGAPAPAPASTSAASAPPASSPPASSPVASSPSPSSLDFALVFHHHLFGWNVTRVTATEIGAPARIPDLPTLDMNACRVGDRVLILTRHDDNELEYRWLTFKDNDFAKPTVSQPQRLETRSQVTPGIALDLSTTSPSPPHPPTPSPSHPPTPSSAVLVTAMPNSRGTNFCMRVTSLKIEKDKLVEQETKWTRGEASGNSCCSRPTIAFSNSGQLNIFHHGWPDATGQMIAYRTSRIGNPNLDEGWLTCKLYDEWTRSRVPVAFANTPPGATAPGSMGGAIFAYRWDAGGPHINWLSTAHNGFGIDDKPMRDFDDGAKISQWGIRQSILWMRPD
jgi:hypothetical protein